MRCSKCNELFFCNRTCLRRSWHVHKRLCDGPRKWVSVEMAIERTIAKYAGETVPVPATATCYVCLEGGDLWRQCACRGPTAGYAHLECLVDAANETRSLLQCPVCLSVHTGTMMLELPRLWWRRVRDRDEPESEMEIKLRLMLYQSGEFEAAASLRRSGAALTSGELVSRAHFHFQAGRYHESIEDADRAVALAELPNLSALNVKAEALVGLGQVVQAEMVARTCVQQARSLYPEDSRFELMTRIWHARALVAAGRLDESRRILRQVLSTRTRLLGPDHVETRASAKELAELEQLP